MQSSGPYNCQCDCILLHVQRLQERLGGHVCAVHAVADMLRRGCLTYTNRTYAKRELTTFVRILLWLNIMDPLVSAL